jgi:hypothetical protein
MTTNDKIAKWLGFRKKSDNEGHTYFIHNKYGQMIIYDFDFAGDRNQQKWIEDELIEEGYEFEYGYVAKDEGWWEVGIYDTMPMSKINILVKSKTSKDAALIEAVLELINKEEK